MPSKYLQLLLISKNISRLKSRIVFSFLFPYASEGQVNAVVGVDDLLDATGDVSIRGGARMCAPVVGEQC